MGLLRSDAQSSGSRIRQWSTVAALALAIGWTSVGSTLAQPAPDPYWPCVQRKVPTLTPAAVWAGPELPDDAEWLGDAEVAALAERLSQRRIPVEDAKQEIADFAATLKTGTADPRLELLFAGLFDTMNRERSDVIDGIERYAKKQIAMANDIRTKASMLDRQRRLPDADPVAIGQAEDELSWQTRVFDERRHSLSYVCDIPRLIERRLFTLAAAISAKLNELTTVVTRPRGR